MKKSGLWLKILISGIFISALFFVFTYKADAGKNAVAGGEEWTQKTGEGYSVPACNSANPPVQTSCNGAVAVATVNWNFCSVSRDVNFDIGSSNNNWDILKQDHASCSGSHTFNASPNSTYWYDVYYWSGHLTETGQVADNGGAANWDTWSFVTPNCGAPSVPTASLSANPSSIFDRESSTLSWSSTDATSCSIDNGIGAVAVSGSVSVSPRSTTAYTLTCSGAGGQAQSQTTITVNYRVPTASLSASPASIDKGQSALLTWQSTDADWCDITNDMGPDVGAVPVNGSYAVSPGDTTHYTLTCFNVVGQATSDASVNVNKTLTVALTANPSTGAFPLATNLTATVGGTETGTINYSFWWNCDNTTRSVQNAETSCGVLNAPAGGGTCGAPNQYGIKCDGVGSPTQTVPHIYDAAGTYKPKVIVERGTTPSSEDRTLVGTCSAGVATAWTTCSATCGGGTQSRDVCNGDGTVRSEVQACNTQLCSFPPGGGGGCSFSSNPASLGLAGNATLSWSCPQNVSSCFIDQGIGSVGPSDSATVHVSQTTTYTLTCSNSGNGGGSSLYTTTVNVGLVPKIIEILPRN